ncbi:hypothetical protein CUJ90_19985 [Paraburkholderia terricola]|nr:hypothetical protein CUJ90_19985 [Paraburkholderia terricola]
MSCATPILPSSPLGHVPEMTGHVAEIAGHHPETAGHVRPKYAIQVLLGHAKLENTALYVQVATDLLHEVTSPLDRLPSA